MRLEILAIVGTVLAVGGVILNNRRSLWCFGLWIISNILHLIVHVHCGVVGMCIRDLMFIALAVEGWLLWRKSRPG